MPIITLCTDFGTRDGYVAAMKGIMLDIAPTATLVDITHDIPPQSVTEAAFVLASCTCFFPAGTIHLIVVDPGVGTARRALAVRTARHVYVAPDNGVLTLALHHDPPLEAVSLTAKRFWRTTEPSSTFHGRDIFAPVAAHLACGVTLTELGQPAGDLAHLDILSAHQAKDGSINGHILHIDRFGNVITDIAAELLAGRTDWSVTLGGIGVGPLVPTYGAVSPGEILALVGSHGFLEIAVREGHAAERLGVCVGDPVQVSPWSQA
ncbi:MAG: SAM-dependent chlorinase/fluorinase [Chloroflexi bacterium]|nr:SAM-dependent chlorinase/fluorinase [Chloroflexota bacterium]